MSYEEFDPSNPEHERWPELQEVVRLFLLMGCERLPPTWADHPSTDTARDRKYMIGNPAFKHAHITILGMTEDEPVPPSLIANWERRLFVTIPKPWLEKR